MKSIIINIVAKYLGVGKVLEWVDGHKTYIAGAGMMLAGLGQVLADAVPVLASKDPSGITAFAGALPTHPGVQLLLQGLAVAGIRHAISKSSEPVPAVPNTAPLDKAGQPQDPGR